MTFAEFQARVLALAPTATVQVQSAYYESTSSRELQFGIYVPELGWVALIAATPEAAIHLLEAALRGSRRPPTTPETLGELEAVQ